MLVATPLMDRKWDVDPSGRRRQRKEGGGDKWIGETRCSRLFRGRARSNARKRVQKSRRVLDEAIEDGRCESAWASLVTID